MYDAPVGVEDVSTRSVAWEAWCGRDLEREVAVVTPELVAFARKDAIERALELWRARHGEVGDPAARAALARLIARGVGTTDRERATLARVLGDATTSTDIRIVHAPGPPTARDIGDSIQRLPRERWVEHLDAIRRTFFQAHASVDEFVVWVVRELWRTGARP